MTRTSFWDVEDSLNALLWNGCGLNMLLSMDRMISNRLKCRRQSGYCVGGGGELGKHCRAALEPFVTLQYMVEL